MLHFSIQNILFENPNFQFYELGDINQVKGFFVCFKYDYLSSVLALFSGAILVQDFLVKSFLGFSLEFGKNYSLIF